MNNVFFKSIKLLKSINNNIFFIVLFSNVIKALYPFINIYLLYKIIELLSTKASTEIIIIYIISLTSLNALFTILNKVFSQYLWSNINNKIYLYEKSSIINKLMEVDYKLLEDSKFMDSVKRYSDDLNNSGSVFISLLFMFSSLISGIISIVVSTIIIFPFIKLISFEFNETTKFQIILIVSLVVGISLILIFSLIINKKNFNLQMEFLNKNKLFSYYSQLCSDYKKGKDIRIYQCEDLLINHATHELLFSGTKINDKIGKYKGINIAISALIGSLICCSVYLLLGMSALEGLLSIALLVKYTSAFMQIIEGLKSLSTSIGIMSYIVPKQKLYYNIIDYPVTKNNSNIDVPKNINTIEFKRVSFSYPNNSKNALNDVSIRINSGETIAFVGQNGSGKSTFIKLLCGLYDNYKGQIIINDIPINNFNKKQFYDIFSVTSQDFSVFSLPICENIAFSKNYDINKMKSALKEVGMLDRIEEMKYKEKTYLYHDCDEEGVEISGGEAQKLALARCLYKDSKIIILDEPTSALDPISEANVYMKLNNYIKENKKTAILISHRLSSCFFCDKIAVFDKGRIIEFGSHNELINNKNSKYYELWSSQAQYYI